jgi:hypothetical protein
LRAEELTFRLSAEIDWHPGPGSMVGPGAGWPVKDACEEVVEGEEVPPALSRVSDDERESEDGPASEPAEDPQAAVESESAAAAAPMTMERMLGFME